MSIITPLFSFETIFVLWLFSYQFKNASFMFTSPDVTFLLTILLIPWGLFLYSKNKTTTQARFWDRAVLVFLIMSLWFIITSFWSPSHAYKLQKTLCYTIYTVPGFLMGYLIISQDPNRIKRLMRAFFIFSILILAENYRIFYLNGLKTISEILNTNYLITGQTLGVGLLVLISYSYFEFLSRVNEDKIEAGDFTSKLKMLVYSRNLWFWSLILCSLFFYVLINSGGRGPVISTTVAISILYGVRSWQDSRSKTGIYFGTLALLCIFSYLILNRVFEHTGSHFENRFSPLLTGQIDEAVIERFTYYQSAFDTFLQHPIVGIGLGGWPISHGLGEMNLHPHNIFLEVLSETGLIGLVGFMTLLIFSVKDFRIRFIFSTSSATSITLITLFSFINAQKTGDLHDNLLLFLSLSLCAGIKQWKKEYAHHRF